jgi:hypothetical protein
VTEPVARRRQRRIRPRITYTTTPTTIRIISTHNHPDIAASLVGAAAVRGDATADHPGKQLPRAQANPGSGPAAALRARGDPSDLPAELGWPGRATVGGQRRPLGVGTPATPPVARLLAGREATP